MKTKKLTLALLSLAALGISGCATQPSASESGVSTEEPSSSAEEPSSSVENSNSFVSDPYGSPWGAQIASVMYDLYGQDIPFPTGTTKVKYGVSKDDYGDPMLILMCSFEDSDAIEAAVQQYAIDANDAGYSVTSVDYDTGFSAYECRLPYDGYKTLVIQTTYGGADLDEDGETEDYMGIFVWSEIAVDPYGWPVALIDNIISPSTAIPAFEGTGITYNSSELTDSDLGNYVSIVVYGVSEGDDENYKKILEDAGYNVAIGKTESYEDEYGDIVEGSEFYLAWVDETFFIQFCYGYDYYNSASYMDINIAKGNVFDNFDIA